MSIPPFFLLELVTVFQMEEVRRGERCLTANLNDFYLFLSLLGAVQRLSPCGGLGPTPLLRRQVLSEEAGGDSFPRPAHPAPLTHAGVPPPRLAPQYIFFLLSFELTETIG